MKKIRTLIIDDEPLARDGLSILAESDPEIELAGTCADGQSAIDTIRAEHPDLIFLDVQMPRFDGFEVLAALAPAERPVVVFITAFEQHAIRAFEVNAIDYLLKPFTDERFLASLARAKDVVRRGRTSRFSQQIEELLEYVRRLEASAPAAEPAPAPTTPAPEYADRIVLKFDGALNFIKTRDVLWIEAEGDFVKVQTRDSSQLVRETLQSMERKLDAAKFLRIHRSFLVNLEHVQRVETALYGDYSVYMSDGTKLRLSRNYRAKLKAVLKRVPVA